MPTISLFAFKLQIRVWYIYEFSIISLLTLAWIHCFRTHAPDYHIRTKLFNEKIVSKKINCGFSVILFVNSSDVCWVRVLESLHWILYPIKWRNQLFSSIQSIAYQSNPIKPNTLTTVIEEKGKKIATILFSTTSDASLSFLFFNFNGIAL